MVTRNTFWFNCSCLSDDGTIRLKVTTMTTVCGSSTTVLHTFASHTTRGIEHLPPSTSDVKHNDDDGDDNDDAGDGTTDDHGFCGDYTAHISIPSHTHTHTIHFLSAKSCFHFLLLITHPCNRKIILS